MVKSREFNYRRFLLAISFVCLASIAYVGGNWGLYLYSDRLYESIVVSGITSRTQLEEILRYSKSGLIDIKDSKWGNHIELGTNQICVQYCILGFRGYPIDVIFEDTTNIVQVISSYE